MEIGAMERSISLVVSRTRMMCEALLERSPWLIREVFLLSLLGGLAS